MVQITPIILPTEDRLESAEESMLQGVQPVTFLKHHFAPGIYVREIWMPEGALILGHQHSTEHLNIITQGEALVRIEGRVERIVAPYIIKSGAGVRKALFILKDMIWTTVHANPDNETNIEKLEERLAVKSAAFKRHEAREAQNAFNKILENTK